MEQEKEKQNYKIPYYICLVCVIIMALSIVYTNVFKEKTATVIEKRFYHHCSDTINCKYDSIVVDNIYIK